MQKARRTLQRASLLVLCKLYGCQPKLGPRTAGRRFCAVRAFWPQAKTSAEAEFISAEHFKNLQVSKKKHQPTGWCFFLSCPESIDAAARSSDGPSGPRRECGVNSERSGELRRGGFADPEHLNLRRVEVAYGRRNPKRKTRFATCLSFCLVRKV